jgi:inner membrane protein
VLPDIDSIGRPFGLGDIAFLGGHRGLTHSLPFALVVGLSVAILLHRAQPLSVLFGRAATYLSLAAVSHGLLDTLTAYGEGVELLAPFSSRRFTAPWHPLDGFNEIVWIWLPALVMLALVYHVRRSGGEMPFGRSPM